MELQARWQCRLEKAKAEALRAADVHEKVGATEHMEVYRVILRNIEEKTKKKKKNRLPLVSRIFGVRFWKRRLLTLHSQSGGQKTISRTYSDGSFHEPLTPHLDEYPIPERSILHRQSKFDRSKESPLTASGCRKT